MQKHANLVDIARVFFFRSRSYIKVYLCAYIWRRYSRERASESLEVIQLIFSFTSLGTADGAVSRLHAFAAIRGASSGSARGAEAPAWTSFFLRPGPPAADRRVWRNCMIFYIIQKYPRLVWRQLGGVDGGPALPLRSCSPLV